VVDVGYVLLTVALFALLTLRGERLIYRLTGVDPDREQTWR
jgi:hypothetical protein